MQSEPSFVLNGSTLAVIGGVLGALSGAITFLAHKLIDTKDAEIASLQRDNETLRNEREQMATLLRTERDFFRDMALKITDLSNKR